MPPRNKRLTVKEQILDWFDRNPGSKARSGPLAKALKMGSTTCADALAKLAAEGKLSRIKTKIDEGSGQGTRPEQWEYSIPAPETVAQPRTPTPFKPLGAQPRVYRRHSPDIENAPSVMTGPVHAPAQMFQEPQPAVGQNTGSLASGGYPSTHAPEGQAVTQPPKPDETPVEAGGYVKEGAAPIPAPDYDPRQVSFNEGDRAVALAVRNHNLIAAICEAIGFDDDQPTDALVEHVKALQLLAEKRLNDLKSMVSAAQKFCAWVADEFPQSRFPLNLHECQLTIKQNLERSDEDMVERIQQANEAQARVDDLDKALDQTLVERDAYHTKADQLAQAIAEYFGADIGEHSSGNCPWDEALNIITESDTGKLYSPTIEAKAPEAYAVVAPKKPIQRFSARHNADQAATAAARTVGSAEIYGMYRIARASRGAVVIREA